MIFVSFGIHQETGSTNPKRQNIDPERRKRREENTPMKRISNPKNPKRSLRERGCQALPQTVMTQAMKLSSESQPAPRRPRPRGKTPPPARTVFIRSLK